VNAAASHPDPIPLADLRLGESAVVTGLAASRVLDGQFEEGAVLLARLRDLGFIAGARCEILARMWLGGDPLVVRIGGSTFALRRAEAAAVRVLRHQERLSPATLGPRDASAATV
jgi:ferrous iron transport protein A